MHIASVHDLLIDREVTAKRVTFLLCSSSLLDSFLTKLLAHAHYRQNMHGLIHFVFILCLSFLLFIFFFHLAFLLVSFFPVCFLVTCMPVLFAFCT